MHNESFYAWQKVFNFQKKYVLHVKFHYYMFYNFNKLEEELAKSYNQIVI